MEGLKLYQALITEDCDGLMAMSLVSEPATESNWVAFSKEKQCFAIEDEEKHILCGVGMMANKPIYRRNADGYEYYIQYSPDTIRYMMQKMLRDNTFNTIDIQHNGEILPKGSVELVELFIKDEAKGINPSFLKDVTDGSLICSYKVNNDELWQMCKDGTLNGFSLEGYFTIQEQKYNKINNTNKNLFMKLKEALKALLVQLGSVDTKDGVTIEYDGDALEVGVEVNVEDGEYTLEDDKVLVVEEGKVAEIKEAEAEAEETTEEVVEEVEAEEETTEEVVEETTPEIEALKAEVDALKAMVESLKQQIDEFLSQPIDTPIEEAFEKIEEVEEDKWARLSEMIAKNRR